MSTKSKVIRVFEYILLCILSFICIFPFFWIIVAATNRSVDVTSGTMIPGTYFMENLNAVLASSLNYVNAYKNSLVISVLTTALAMLLSSAAGYSFEIFRSKGRERAFKVILVSMMVPFASLMVPLFRLAGKLSNLPILCKIGLNTYGVVIMPAIATAFLIFFFRQSTKSFPRELLEAARIDGLGELGIFFRIYMPTMKSTYAAAIVVTFMSAWNNYMWPLVSLQTQEMKTLPLIISAMGSSYTPDYGMMMTAVLLATVPTAILFFAMQKHFVAGMTGSVKG